MTAAGPQTNEDFQNYLRSLAERRVEDDPRLRTLHAAKRIMWMLLAACSFLFFYLLDRLAEALSLL